MLFNSLNTGSTDLRDTEVQQPNTAATLSCVMSWRAFSANSGQLEAGSTTTASILRPITPPLALISSKVISAVFLSAVSLIAIVPDSEWRTPTLIGALSSANTLVDQGAVPAAAIKPAEVFIKSRLFICITPCQVERATNSMTGLRDVFVLHTATPACLLRYGATVSQQACRS